MASEHKECFRNEELTIIKVAIETYKDKQDEIITQNKEILRTLRGSNGDAGLVGKVDTQQNSMKRIWTTFKGVGIVFLTIIGWIILITLQMAKSGG